MDGSKKQLNRSIQFWLSVYLSAAILLVAVVTGALSFLFAFDEAHELQDESLRQTASLIDHVPSADEIILVNGTRGSDTDSDLLILNLNPFSDPVLFGLVDGLHTLDQSGKKYRAFIRTLPDTARIAILQKTELRDEIANDSAIRTLLPLLILVPILLLVVTWLVASFASKLLASLLATVGFDTLPARIGMAHAFEKTSASSFVGHVALFFAMLFATVEAAGQLGFSQVSGVVTTFITFGGDVLLGSAILVIGFWLANVAYTAIDRASGPNTKGLARIARFAILALVLAMGLRAMGIADDIVNLAFGLTLGAVAVAVAVAAWRQCSSFAGARPRMMRQSANCVILERYVIVILFCYHTTARH